LARGTEPAAAQVARGREPAAAQAANRLSDSTTRAAEELGGARPKTKEQKITGRKIIILYCSVVLPQIFTPCQNLFESSILKFFVEGSVVRIRDVFPGSEFFPSRIRIRIFPSRQRTQNSKNCF
jgi:hypothetical protein